MIAGRLTYRLELLEPVEVVTGFGSRSIEWQSRGVVRAERVRFAGRRSEEADEHFADYSAEWNIRAAHRVAEGWRVRQAGMLYEITNVEPNPRKGYKALKTQRVNE